jgi:hypothetical protein
MVNKTHPLPTPPAPNKREFICKGLVRIILSYEADTRAINTQRDNNLPAIETDFWRRPARKSRKGKFGSATPLDVGKNVLKLNNNNKKMFRWFGQVMRMPGNRES